MLTLEKTYTPRIIEEKHYQKWEENGAFACDVKSASKPYTIMMPPPNVTGVLHIGHALGATLQDILIRYHRKKGFDVLWQPGTDHAGISTQMMVERQLASQGITKHDLGRKAFLKKVWEWKEQSGGTIVEQFKRLGASPDWSRERFTMDEGLNHAVRKVFVELYNQGLIYRAKRLVNWDPKLRTAVSDLEVVTHQVQGHLWHIKYPIIGRTGIYITVATTRPETLFGDVAVAVHPDDSRYKDLVGEHALLPFSNRSIPIIADASIDLEKGTGAVKITPAHDFNDFAISQRHGLPHINIFTEEALLNENVPESFQGLSREKARQEVLEALRQQDLLPHSDPITHTVPHGERTGAVIEPFLTDQWFVDAAVLAAPALQAVEEGRTKFVPERWANTYFEWLRNIQPWCISRQLWWGHQIPAWYGPDHHIFVSMSAEEALDQARNHYGQDVELRQDEDVLDTWFSAALWPFSTLGWPTETPELNRYYPGDILLTGFDIIFFWVARMMMMGLHFMKDVPFHTVVITGLVRDQHGHKMSKTKGNVVDPLVLIDQYGADAVRFTLTALATPGTDINFAPKRVEGYRNFATKIWNVARYCLLNHCLPDPNFQPQECQLAINRWIVERLDQLIDKTDEALQAYRFDELAHVLYREIWDIFCDWYIEFTKPILSAVERSPEVEETRATVAWALQRILNLLHPIMPFITEEINEALGISTSLVTSLWPLKIGLHDPKVALEMDWVIRIVSNIRTVRAEMNIPPALFLEMHVYGAEDAIQHCIMSHIDLIKRLARLEEVFIEESLSPQESDLKGAAQVVLDQITCLIPLAQAINLDMEQQRLQRESLKISEEIDSLAKRLHNENFLAKATPETIKDAKDRYASACLTRDKIDAALARLQ